MKTFNEKFNAVLKNEPDNYLLPFLWVHNEDDELLKREIHKVYESGIRAVCVESRTHEEFGKDDWWSDMQLIFDECEKLGMEVWLLDDKHFPTGFAVDQASAPENAHLVKRRFTELHTDVVGPIKNANLIIDTKLPENPDIVKIVAYKRNSIEFEYSSECIDLTDKYEDGLIKNIDLPEGIWSVFTVFTYPVPEERHIDTLNPEACDILVNAVYEPMYEHFSKYFGNIFKGFFSDEPYIARCTLPTEGETSFNGALPCNHLVFERLIERFGDDALCKLPSLLYNVEGVSPEFRVAYMDIVSTLYAESFCQKLGDWSRAHGVEYIGHVIEDNSRDTKFASGAHFFRSMDGQDMGGIDVVLNEILPGFQDCKATICHGIQYADHEFFHYELAKLASSHSHIQKDVKKGRAMCEMYGAFGWAEGLKMMKWLSDHMLVRGINYFVPHAFSGISPDYDCPPHFYEGGTYSQFKDFKSLMEYSNRVSTLLTDGDHKCKVALYYRAEGEWSGGRNGHEKKYAKILTDNQIDFDIIPLDYLLNAAVEDGSIVLCDEKYPCIVVPNSEYLPIKALRRFAELAEAGVKVIFAGGYTDKSCEGESVSFLNGENLIEVAPEKLVSYLRSEGLYDISLSRPHQNLRYYRYINGNNEIYMFVNEDILKNCETVVYPEGFNGGTYIEYDAMNNVAVKKVTNDGIKLNLEPYNSVFIILGDVDADIPSYEELTEVKRTLIPESYDVSLAEGSEDYTFTPFKKDFALCNINALPGMDRFAGHIKYETKVNVVANGYKKLYLEIENAGETVNVTVNGKNALGRIVPPYKFDITDLVKTGENELEIIVTTHMGFRERDKFSRYMVMEPTGMSGKVELVEYK